MHSNRLLHSYPIISDQITAPALSIVVDSLNAALEACPSGAVVEFGCYVGTTSLFIRRVLDQRGESSVRQFHVYDSFQGLPSKGAQDQSVVGLAFQAGELSISKKQLQREFVRAKLAPPIIHKAWFHELHDNDVPQEISFAFLDGDFYASIMDSLRLAWPRLRPGGIIVIDDYGREALPGVTRAVTDFFRHIPVDIHSEQQLAIIHKPPATT